MTATFCSGCPACWEWTVVHDEAAALCVCHPPHQKVDTSPVARRAQPPLTYLEGCGAEALGDGPKDSTGPSSGLRASFFMQWLRAVVGHTTHSNQVSLDWSMHALDLCKAATTHWSSFVLCNKSINHCYSGFSFSRQEQSQRRPFHRHCEKAREKAREKAKRHNNIPAIYHQVFQTTAA